MRLTARVHNPRRYLYLGFFVILVVIALILLMLHDFMWFLVVLLPLMALAAYDMLQTKKTIPRNFPVLGRLRYIMEFFRPEVHQYFVAGDQAERPFNREVRDVVYRRAKNINDTIPFGTEKPLYDPGAEWVNHSLSPIHHLDVDSRVTIGSPACKQPYSASRLNISAMSFGALSDRAILALNKGAKIGQFLHNTGEGGLSDYHLEGGGDLTWQIGTGYFGCRTKKGEFDPEQFATKANLPNVKMIELKLSQGAKPGHGGVLPAVKVTEEISRIRGVPMGEDVLSPPAHSAFSTPEELLRFIDTLRQLSGGKPVGFKLCIGNKREFMSICKAMLSTKIVPDFITVDGAEGGTGASPMEFTDFVGTPLREGLVFVHNCLIGINLRDKIRVFASAKVATGFDMITKLALGADVCNAARSMMLSMGCIQSQQCNLNTCPTGIATQQKRLKYGLVVDEKKIRVAHYHGQTIQSFLTLVAAMGIKHPGEIIPAHIMRRIDQQTIKSYAEIYEWLTPGALLAKQLPVSFAKAWQSASSGVF